MTRTDAQIAREWAETNANVFTATPLSLDQRNAIAAHILATTTPPTMADVDWDDAVHAGLCAESTDDGVVRMIGLDWVNDHADHILCYLRPGAFDSLPMRSLTPLPGTRVDLTPCRPEDVPDDSPLIPEDDWRYASDATVALWHRLVPESTPDHPAVLTIEAEYRNAPEGTVVATEGEGAWTWTKGRDGRWETFGIISGYNNYAMADEARQVLRWGWEA